jgi:Aerotolerance regulator N-terminal/von Willebrand factor type A domain
MLSSFFGLWQTTAAVAGAAIAVPIVIHLLNRRRFKTVTWAAMRFLLAAQKQNTRRMRLEQILLLLVRCAMVALLVFAMASVMPWAESVWGSIGLIGNRGFPRAARTHHVFVFDGSLSMNVSADGKSWFDAARDRALRKMDNCPPGDGFSVLFMKDSPTWIVPEASADAAKVKREIEAIQPSHGNASLPAALNMVSAKLGEFSGRYPNQAVYFFSDFQKTTWSGLTGPKEGEKDDKDVTAEIQAKARTVFVDVGKNDVANMAVSDLSLISAYALSGEETGFLAQVHNYGPEPKFNPKMEILVGKAKEGPGDGPLTLRNVGHQLVGKGGPNTVQGVAFTYKFPTPGTYVVQVKLDTDPLELDNVRSLVLTVKETIPVLIVNGKPAPDPFDRASEFLRLALNPFPKGAEPRFAPIRPKVVTPAQFQELPEADLAVYDCIFLADVPQLGPAEVRKLETHVRRGGGLVVAMGDKAADNFEFYNRALFKQGQGLLPAELMKRVTAPADHHFSLLGQEADFATAPLVEFRDPDYRAALLKARFRTYVEAKLTTDTRARVLLSYQAERSVPAADGAGPDKDLPRNDPAIVEWNPPLPRLEPGPIGRSTVPPRMRGKVVLLTSTLNLDWNTWPGSPSFGAMMQELTRFAMSGRLREQASPVGTPIEEYLPAAGGELEASLFTPNLAAGQKPPKVRTQLIDDINVFRFADTDISGIYKLALTNQNLEIPYAINVPATVPGGDSESNLARHDKDSLHGMFPAWDFQFVQDPLDAAVQPNVQVPAGDDLLGDRLPVGPDIARWALWLVLALLLIEVIIAWRFGHYSSVEGASATAATGMFWPLVIVGAATLLFTIGAAILWHDARTQDFLSFLPESWRGRIEVMMGVPAPPPGEMTHWELERTPIIPGMTGDGWTLFCIGVVAVLMVVLIYLAEAPHVRPVYKLTLAALRLFLVFTVLGVFMPQLQLRIDRQSWPDVVFLFDTSRSMGEPDIFQDEKVRKKAKELGERIKKQVSEKLPAKIQATRAELSVRMSQAEKDPSLKIQVQDLQAKLTYLENMAAQIEAPNWRPSRLQLVQSLLLTGDRDWIGHFVNQRRMRVHLYELDMAGRAVKVPDSEHSASDVNDNTDPAVLDRAREGVMNLEAEGKESRLGTALRQVIDQYRGQNLAGVVMFTDGVTTRDETIGQVAEYAAQKAVPLLFVGVGDDHEIRDLRLHDLQCEDSVYVNDRLIFEARLTGQGYKDMTVPVVLKVKEKNGKERELERTQVKVDPSGKAVKLRLAHEVKDVGRKTFVIEVVAPKTDGDEKGPVSSNLRLERTIDVLETKLIRVLYVEGQPRYEFRFLKFFLEREAADAKKNKSIELSVVLNDADRDFFQTDRVTLRNFPTTQAELAKYDVIVIGDVNPQKLEKTAMNNIVTFVRGSDEKGKATERGGGGLLMIAGPMYAPHAYKNTPLASVLPIEPLTEKPPPERADHVEKLKLELTPMGRQNPIFRFVADEAGNQAIWQRLAPMYWWAHGYKLKPLAEVLAVHPTQKADVPPPGGTGEGRLPLAVHQFVGSGRSLFFGFDETWRWRFRDDEVRFNKFWVQTLRFLARGRSNRTDLRLDRQTPYRVGEPIKITVRFPENMQMPDGKNGEKPDVKVVVEYRPNSKADDKVEEVQVMSLTKIEGSLATFEDQWKQTREGKYKFRLLSPNVPTPDGEKPSAEATVELPPGELDRLRMNQQEMTQAADQTGGHFYTLATADTVPDEVPGGGKVLTNSPRPAERIWNTWPLFLWAMLLVTGEWILRKRKHLL